MGWDWWWKGVRSERKRRRTGLGRGTYYEKKAPGSRTPAAYDYRVRPYGLFPFSAFSPNPPRTEPLYARGPARLSTERDGLGQSQHQQPEPIARAAPKVSNFRRVMLPKIENVTKYSYFSAR